MQESNTNIIYHYLSALPYHIYGFFLTIYNLIQPEEGLLNDNHAVDVVDFVDYFETRYGSRRPNFLTDDYVTCINKAKSSLRFLLLYLHGDDHEDSDYFCRNTLCSDIFLDYLNQSDILFWGCNINSIEGFRVSKIVREHSYPFIGIVTINPNNRMYLVARHEGLLPVKELIAFISATLDNNATGIVACKAQREEREFNRELRHQQEAEYAECLRIDQERDSASEKVAAMEIQVTRDLQKRDLLNKVWQSRRHKVRELLPSQPMNGDSGHSVVLRVKFPSGSITQRTFYQYDSTKLLFYWIYSLDECPEDFSVFTNFPKNEILCRPSDLEIESASITRLPRTRYLDPVSFTNAGLVTETLLYVVDNAL